MPRRALALAVLVLAALTAPAVRAEHKAVLGRDAAPRLTTALQPFASGRPVGGGWVLGDIAISATEARLSLTRGGRRATLILGRASPAPSDGGPPPVPVGSTPSFEAWVVGVGGVPLPRGAAEAGRALVDQLRSRDDGAFFTLLSEPPLGRPGAPRSPAEDRLHEPPRGADPPPGRGEVFPDAPAPTSPLAFGLVGALTLLLWGAWLSRRGARPWSAGAGVSRWTWVWPVVLGIAAWVLRVELGPTTLLHENGHGVHYLARVFGVEAPLRPMGGVTGLHQLLAALVAPSWSSILAVHAALGAAQAPLVYGLSRALGVRVLAAALAGAVMAALPVAVRMAGSEDAFTPGTTFALAGVVGFVAGLRRGVGPWMVAGLGLIAVGGYFRPLLFTAAAPVAAAAFLLPPRASETPPRAASEWPARARWLWLLGAVVAYWAVAAPEVPHLLRSLRADLPITSGWWNGRGLRNWALLDPHVTPPWVPGVALAGWAAVVVRGPAPRRRAALWLGGVLLWMSYWLTSDNGQPASLRYAVGYAWAVAALVGLAVDALPREARRWALWVAGALVVATPARYAGFISHEYAQQAELRFQRERVLPALQVAGPGVTLVTPWPEVRGVGGTTLAAALRPPGLRVVGLDLLSEVLARRGRAPARPLFWYRSLSCYLRIANGDTWGPVSYAPGCAAVDAAGGWEAVATRALKPASDADWIDLGDGHTPVVVGLYRWVGRGRGAVPSGPASR